MGVNFGSLAPESSAWLASPILRALALEARAYVIWDVFWLVEEVPRAD